MEEIKKKFSPSENGQSRGEWIYVFVLRLIAGIFLASILYIPIYTRFMLSLENVQIPSGDVWYALGCVVMFGSPGKMIGEFLNSIAKRLLNLGK